ncbi:ABC transporter permease [Mobilitalea sibirica]
MKKRKPYYIIIAIFCFTAIFNIFLPYLKLPEREPINGNNVLDLEQAALRSHIIDRVAKEEGMKKSLVTNIARNILKDKEFEAIVKDLNEEQYYIVDVITSEINNKVAQLEKLDNFNESEYSFFGTIKLSASIIKYLEQDLIDSVLVIFSMISTIVLLVIGGIYMLITKGSKNYGMIRKLSIATLLLSLLGLISSNAISIGALQVKEFYSNNWGPAFFIIIFISIFIWLLATIASYHEQVAGFVTWRMVVRQKQLIILAIPFILYAFIFNYYPLAGWTMAFQKFRPAADQQMWVAWDKFKFIFSSREFFDVFRNTVAMSLINLIFSFVFAIGFALLLNEVRFVKGKKFVQTVSYLPHFLSWIIVAGIVRDVLSMETGIINELMIKSNMIDSAINFFADPKYFWWIIGFAVVWKETGWNSIIYLASITSINPDLYEAASIDGAGRFKKMWHITLPGIKPTIFVLLIINLGMIMNSGFEAQYLLGTSLTKRMSDVIDIYVLNYSFGAGVDFSLGTAAGIFKSVVSILLIFLANRASKAAGQERLF